MKNILYSFENLHQYCKNNNIELDNSYSNILINRDTKILGKCVMQNCNLTFNKSYRELIKNNSFYCGKCLKSISQLKRKQTCLEMYGVNNVMNNEEIKNKLKTTILQKYGVNHTFQCSTIKDKIKKTNIERYGVDNPNKNPKIREKGKKTCLEKYGVEHIMQNNIFKEQYNNIINEKFGVKNISQSCAIKEKKIVTCLKNYKVNHPSQSLEIKQKKIETSLKNYGVEHPMQNSKFLEKYQKTSYNYKLYTFPSGKIIKTQGDENYALDELVYKELVNEDNIVTGVKNVPIIWYLGVDNKRHRHYVDIFIPIQNRCIEVKSSWTFNCNQHNVFLKQNSAKELGYSYEIWIYNEKKQKIKCLI